MRWVKKTRAKLFRLSFPTGGSSRKSSFNIFDWIHQSETQLKQPFSDCVRKPDLGFSSKKAVFD